jgi:site-specific DNA-methyltransferase (adenine-specific)
MIKADTNKTIIETEDCTVPIPRQHERLVSLPPFYTDENTILFCGDSAKVLTLLPENSIDLTVTSPPYDNMRTYKGFTFDFETIAKELYRVTKEGGVVVWIVNDATIDGSETLTSAKQKIFFREGCGWLIHDTMIWEKPGASNPSQNRYHQIFEYMIVLSKGQPKTFNGLKDRKNKWLQRFGKGTVRTAAGNMEHTKQDRIIYGETGLRNNVWYLKTASQENVCAENEHPAPFSEELALDHIKSWSNEGDTVLDCFSGSGTTLKAAKLLKRNSIGIEIAKEYCELTVRRINKPIPLFEAAS